MYGDIRLRVKISLRVDPSLAAILLVLAEALLR